MKVLTLPFIGVNAKPIHIKSSDKLKADHPASLELARYRQTYQITRSLDSEGMI